MERAGHPERRLLGNAPPPTGFPRLAFRPPASYIEDMHDALGILLIIAMVATAGVLLLGLTALARGGEFNRKYANTFMRWRVMLQALAVALFGLLLLLAR